MPARFVTIHPNRYAEAAWVGYIDERDQAYVWVPELKRFAFNDAVTDDLAWDRELVMRSVDPMRARQLCDADRIGRTSDPSQHWLVDALAAAPSIEPGRILPAANPPASRSQQVEAALQQLKKDPHNDVIYATYRAEDKTKAVRAASDLRNGRVAAFEKILPGVTPEVRVLPTDDASHLVIVVKAKAATLKHHPGKAGKGEKTKNRPSKPHYSKTSLRLGKAKKMWPTDLPLTKSLVGQRVVAKASHRGAKVSARVTKVTNNMVGRTLDEVLTGRERRKASRRTNLLAIH